MSDDEFGREKKPAAKKNSIRARLVEGEKILMRSRVHWAIYLKPLICLFIAVLFFFVASRLGALFCFFALIYLLYNHLKASIFMFVVTNKRVFARYGLLMIDVVDVHFDKIESIELERMLPGFLLGYANLVVMGTGNRYISIPYVENGFEIRQVYNEATLTD